MHLSTFCQHFVFVAILKPEKPPRLSKVETSTCDDRVDLGIWEILFFSPFGCEKIPPNCPHQPTNSLAPTNLEPHLVLSFPLRSECDGAVQLQLDKVGLKRYIERGFTTVYLCTMRIDMCCYDASQTLQCTYEYPEVTALTISDAIA